MHRLLPLLLLLSLAAASRPAAGQTALRTTADEPRSGGQPDFDEHLAGDPNTVGNLKWDYETFPGAPFFERSIIASTLAIGVGDRWEIGTVPVFYMFSGGNMIDRNITLKYNFVRNRHLSLAVGYLLRYQQIHVPSFSYAGTDGATIATPDRHERMYQQGVSLFGAFTLSPDFDLGLNLSTTFTRSDDPQLNDVLKRMPEPFEEYLDLCYHVSPAVSVTTGASHTSYSSDDFLTTAYQYGFGSTLTWHRPKAFFSEPAFGVHHLLHTHENVYLVSTSFY